MTAFIWFLLWQKAGIYHADNLTFTFHLRNDVFFQDNDAFPNGKGRKMTAQDVVYSFKRIMDKNTASSGAWIFNSRVDSIHPFSAIDDTTFQLKLVAPFQPDTWYFEHAILFYCSQRSCGEIWKGFSKASLWYRPFSICSLGRRTGIDS